MISDSRAKGLQTFTQAFCQTIRADPGPATVAQIHARLISQWQDKAKGNYLQTTPVYKAAASFDKPSIILAPSNVPPVKLKPGQSDTPKVLITVHLDDETPLNLAEWRNWLRRQNPTNVAEIHVEGVFETGSKLVLLRLPVAIWDMLPDDDAYSFVGFVQSSNLIVEQFETAASEIPLPPPIKLRYPKRKKSHPGGSEWP
jgi:hypothetical protein